MATDVNWGRIARAIDFYKRLGYEYMEVPWNVSKETILSTIPNPDRILETAQGFPVGSGEQSFIELLRAGRKIDKAVCCTPCFRQEEEYDDIHFPYFMKVELIDTTYSYSHLEEMVLLPKYFLKSEGIITKRVLTGTCAYDLEDESGMELGSYGLRDLGDIRFVYGTGLAEPRASISLENNKS